MFRLLKYIKKRWWAVLLIYVLLVVQVYLQLELPDLMSKIMSTLQNFELAEAEKINYIWQYGLQMLGYCFGILLAAIGVGGLNNTCVAVLGKNIRDAVYQKVMNFSLEEFTDFGTASLLTRTTNDINTFKDVYGMAQRNIVFAPLMLIIAVCKAFVLDPIISLVFVVTIPLLIVAIVIVFSKASPLFSKIQKKTDNLTMVLRESLTGVRVIRAFNQQGQEFDRFKEKNRELTDMSIKVGRTFSFISPVINTIFNLAYIGVFFVGFMTLDGMNAGVNHNAATTFTNIITIANYSSNIMMSFLLLGMITLQIPRASASAKRILEILDKPLSIEDPLDPIDVSSIQEEDKCKVEFKNVTFTFPGSMEPTLKNINFTCLPGQTTAIIGSTGSGKSSIINLIPRFYDVSIGEIRVDGINVKNYKQHDLRNKIGFVPQQANLFSGTIKENLLYGKKDATDEEIEEALKVAQASKFVHKKEDGINSYVSQGGKNFSGGQKQRLSIARALVKKPEIYIFDDSFSALDFRTDIKLRTALKSYVGNSSVIIVAQRVSSIIDADNILVLNEGEIVGQGKHEYLLHNCPIYQQIVLSQLDKDEIEKTIKLKQKALESKDDEGGDE